MTLNMKTNNLTFKGHLQHNDLNSKQLLQQLLANQHRVQNLSAYMIHLTSNWDIQKALQTPSIVSIKSTQWCIDNGLDGECLAILTFDVQGACKLVHVATRVDETEIDDDEEFFTISWLDGKAQVKRTFKTFAKDSTNRFVHVVINLLYMSKRQIKHTFNADSYQAWQIEKAQTKRLRQAAEVKFAKAILQCIDVNSLDDYGIVDKGRFQVALLNSFNSLWQVMQNKFDMFANISNIVWQPNIKDFDFDDSSNKLYLDIHMQWIASTSDDIVTDKWCTLTLRTHRFEISHADTQERLKIAASIALVECMMALPATLQRLCRKDDIFYHLLNLSFSSTGFDRSLMEHFGLYKKFGVARKFVCK